MHVTHRLIALTVICGLALNAGTARAQDAEVDVDVQPPATPPPPDTVVVRQETVTAEVDVDDDDDFYDDSIFFAEAFGGGGFQLGDTEYLPSGTPGDWQFPVVYGFTVGGTVGLMLSDDIAVIVSYGYQRAQTRDGDLENVIENVEGRIDYHTAILGLRLYVPTGFGAFRGELGVGFVFPHSTELQIDYGPALALLPEPITGTGFRVTDFSFGYGGQARIGYEIRVFGPLYLALDLQLQVFQAENAGEVTELRNFVVDFAAMPPTAVNAVIRHGDGEERPETRGVGSGNLMLSVGVRI